MIVADHISKFYGARQALKDLSFEIDQGEVVGFLGLNGAGKTTVLKILSGLLMPSSGRVTIDGLDSQLHPREVRRKIGFLPDRPPLYGDMTVRSMLRYAGRLNGVGPGDIERHVDEVIERCQLKEVEADLVDWLSHGFKQRLGIAQAIVHDPALVILDEPISGLDPEQIVGMRGLIRSLSEKHTVLLSSHILSEISQTCDRILVLHEGRIVAQGKERELAEGLFGGTVEVVVRGGFGPAQEAAEGVKGVSEVELVSIDGDLVELSAKVESEEAKEALVKALVDKGLGIRRVAERQGAGLESVFLRLTRKGAAASPAPEGEKAVAEGGAA